MIVLPSAACSRAPFPNSDKPLAEQFTRLGEVLLIEDGTSMTATSRSFTTTGSRKGGIGAEPAS